MIYVLIRYPVMLLNKYLIIFYIQNVQMNYKYIKHIYKSVSKTMNINLDKLN